MKTETNFSDLVIENAGHLSYVDKKGIKCTAEFPRLIIRNAWYQGVDMEDLADGFGKGLGTQGDWSAIRDSSDEAIVAMLQRAMNHFFG